MVNNVTLQDIFNMVVMNDEAVAIPLESKRAYENLRVALVRKFSRYRQQCQNIGLASYDDKFVSATYDPTQGLASFSLKWKEDGKRVPKEYSILKL